MENSILTYYFQKIKERGSYLYQGIIWNSIKFYTYLSQYIWSWNSNDNLDTSILSVGYDNELGLLKILYIIQNMEYILICPIFIDEYMEYLLNAENPSNLYILSAIVNNSFDNSFDITDLLNKLCGPYGTFYYPTILMKIKWIIPKCYIKDFKNLTIIDNEGNDYIYTNLDDSIKINQKCFDMPYFNKYEKEKLIKKSPYI